MADSFFDFDTAIPPEDDGGGGGRDEELEYDALNDETFGAAINGDWEDLHENLVQLEQHRDDRNGAVGRNAVRTKPSEANSRSQSDLMSDLEFSLSKVGLNDVPMGMEDSEGRIILDPSVWSSPIKPNQPYSGNYSMFSRPEVNLDPMRRIPFPQPPSFLPPTLPQGGPKMCTLEDIERNIREQQKQANTQSPQPPPNMGMMPNNHGILPLNNGTQKPTRLPPGFAPINQIHRNSANSPSTQMMPGQNFQGFPPPGMKLPPPQPFPPMPPMMAAPPSPQRNPQQQQMMNANHFNKRLVMEIQQTHPMLCYNRMNVPPNMPPPLHPMHPMFLQQQPPPLPHGPLLHHPFPPPQPHMNPNMMPHLNGAPPNIVGNAKGDRTQPQHNHMNRRESIPNLQEHDEYANLMSQRDKQWLIGIQLMQLNTETPYIDDYYYTVFKERRMKGQRENKIHKDNQLNHPFTQPQGHAQLVLQSIGNKNNNMGGGGQKGALLKDIKRERRNSENNKNNGDKNNDSPRTYTPLQFENSLGKLQCGSVTAPRKIIDMEIMGQENSGQGASSPLEITAQRKSRHLLMHIETLYKVVLKLEDLKNPTAIEAAQILKEKREKEKKLALEQQKEREENAELNGDVEQPTQNGRLNIETPITDKYPEPEKLEELLPIMVAGLTPEKVTAMMNVRKGKTLIRRALPHLVDLEHVWQTWCAIFTCLPAAIKKDRDDADGHLFAFCKILKTQLHKTDFVTLIRIAESILQSEKLALVFKSKFGVGALILIILRAEHLLNKLSSTVNVADRNKWNTFLVALCKVTDQLEQEKEALKAAYSPNNLSNELMEKLIAHFMRFPDVVKSQSLFKSLSRFDIEI